MTLATAWATEGRTAGDRCASGACARVVEVHLPRWRSWANCLAALPTRTPLQAVYSWHPELARLAEGAGTAGGRRACRTPARLRLRPPHPRSPALVAASVPLVWDSVDCISLLFEQTRAHPTGVARAALTRIELGRTRRFEGRLVNSFARTLATSKMDAQALVALAVRQVPACVGIGPAERR